MYYMYSILAGIIIAVMVTINGSLAAFYGLYSATVIIHIVGAVLTLLIMLFKKEPPVITRTISFWIYGGGIIGVTVTICNNLAFGQISVTALLALSLLGQGVASIIIDTYGFFDMPKRTFLKHKLFGFLLTLTGILIMMVPIEVSSVTAILLSFIAGISNVLSRTINALLSEKTSALNSTFFNFFMGLCLGLIIFFFVGRSEPIVTGSPFSKNIVLYSGGFLAVFSVTILNVVVSKISAFYMSLLLFVGQIFAGIFIDALLQGSFSLQTFAGGVFVGGGLCFNLWMDYRVKDR